MTITTYARSLCRKVCAHYGLSKQATKSALEACVQSPAKAARCYKAILESLRTTSI